MHQENHSYRRARGGTVVAVGVIVDRSRNKKPDFGCPFVSLMQLVVETFEPDRIHPILLRFQRSNPVAHNHYFLTQERLKYKKAGWCGVHR